MSKSMPLPKSRVSLSGDAPASLDVRGMTQWLRNQQKGGQGWRSKSLKPRKWV